eukprot:gene517-biopygen17
MRRLNSSSSWIQGHGEGALWIQGQGVGASWIQGHGEGASWIQGHGGGASWIQGHGEGASHTQGSHYCSPRFNCSDFLENSQVIPGGRQASYRTAYPRRGSAAAVVACRGGPDDTQRQQGDDGRANAMKHEGHGKVRERYDLTWAPMGPGIMSRIDSSSDVSSRRASALAVGGCETNTGTVLGPYHDSTVKLLYCHSMVSFPGTLPTTEPSDIPSEMSEDGYTPYEIRSACDSRRVLEDMHEGVRERYGSGTGSAERDPGMTSAGLGSHVPPATRHTRSGSAAAAGDEWGGRRRSAFAAGPRLLPGHVEAEVEQLEDDLPGLVTPPQLERLGDAQVPVVEGVGRVPVVVLLLRYAVVVDAVRPGVAESPRNATRLLPGCFLRWTRVQRYAARVTASRRELQGRAQSLDEGGGVGVGVVARAFPEVTTLHGPVM